MRIKTQFKTHLFVAHAAILIQYSRYWTRTSLQLRLMRGVFPNADNLIPPREPPLQASSSPIPRMIIWSISY